MVIATIEIRVPDARLARPHLQVLLGLVISSFNCVSSPLAMPPDRAEPNGLGKPKRFSRQHGRADEAVSISVTSYIAHISRCARFNQIIASFIPPNPRDDSGWHSVEFAGLSMANAITGTHRTEDISLRVIYRPPAASRVLHSAVISDTRFLPRLNCFCPAQAWTRLRSEIDDRRLAKAERSPEQPWIRCPQGKHRLPAKQQ